MFPFYLKIFVYFNIVGIFLVCLFLLFSKQKGTYLSNNYKKIYVIRKKNYPRYKRGF